jgi:uncharacterized protein (TIGR02145 family)
MKTGFISILICLTATLFTSAQIPDKISYQAIARDTLGNLITNQAIGFKISILEDNINGGAVYSERHFVTVNQLGMINIAIGSGYPLSGGFSAINWGSHSYFIQTEIDPAGGTDYGLLGISPILSVAYSLHAGGLLLQDPNQKLWVVRVNSSGDLYTHLLEEKPWQCNDVLKDTRDGKYYTTVKIGSQCWMAQNLNFGTMVSPVTDQTDNGIIEKYCYEDSTVNCDFYGGLYQWNEMMQYDTVEGTQGICPEGWFIPEDEDWKMLEGTVDSQFGVGDPTWDLINGWRGYDAGKNLKSISGWYENSGADQFGFTLLGGGYRLTYGSFSNLTRLAYMWTSSKRTGESNGWSRWFSYDYNDIFRSYDGFNNGFSVRCIKGWECGETFIDTRDNKSYGTVMIGSQCWMTENMDIGTMIQRTDNQTNNGTIEKYCYENDPANCESNGGIYQWGEAMQYSTTPGSQGICPEGWSVPTDQEWKELEGTVDSHYGVGDAQWDLTNWRGYDAGKNLKSKNGWDNSGNGTDLYGFNAFPGGQTQITGGFCCQSQNAPFWTSSPFDDNNAWIHYMKYYYYLVSRIYIDKNWGYSIRCIKD